MADARVYMVQEGERGRDGMGREGDSQVFYFQ